MKVRLSVAIFISVCAFCTIIVLNVVLQYPRESNIVDGTTEQTESFSDGSIRVQFQPESCAAASVTNFDNIYLQGVWGKDFATVNDNSGYYYLYDDKDFDTNGTLAQKVHNALLRHDQKRPIRSSLSGPGSNVGYQTKVSMSVLRHVIREYNVKTMLDIPCGDVNWIFDSWETDSLSLYIGLDIVQPVIELNKRRYQHHTNKYFMHWDATKCPLPKFATLSNTISKNNHTQNDNRNLRNGNIRGLTSMIYSSVDLIHSRDVLQHLPLSESIMYLCYVFQSGAKVFVTTTFPETTSNTNINWGEFYHNNLKIEPFNLPITNDRSECVFTHPESENDVTCVFNLSQPWVKSWISKKCGNT